MKITFIHSTSASNLRMLVNAKLTEIDPYSFESAEEYKRVCRIAKLGRHLMMFDHLHFDRPGIANTAYDLAIEEARKYRQYYCDTSNPHMRGNPKVKNNAMIYYQVASDLKKVIEGVEA